jgi:hypothetical protein
MTDLEHQLIETLQQYLNERDSALIERFQQQTAAHAQLLQHVNALSADVTNLRRELANLLQQVQALWQALMPG